MAPVSRSGVGKSWLLAEVLKYKVHARLATPEYYRLKSLAAQSGLSQSDLMRQLISQGKVVPRFTIEQVDYIRKLIGMANNLNQLAHEAHIQGTDPLATHCEITATEVMNLIKYIKKW